MHLSSTAIVIFGRSAKAEIKEKFLSNTLDRKSHIQLAQFFIDETYKKAYQSGLPVIPIDETRQRGDTFGERITNAISQVFAQGYDSVITIGNDCPELSVSLIRSAAQHLKHHDWVLGPDHSEGLYLIGLHRHNFDAAYWEHLPWETPALYQEFHQLAQAKQFTVAELPAIHDIDTALDLHLWLSSLQIGDTRREMVTSILHHFTPCNRLPHPVQAIRGTVLTHVSRGPPIFS